MPSSNNPGFEPGVDAPTRRALYDLRRQLSNGNGGGGGGGLTQAEADLLYVNIPGDTMTGALTLPGPPTLPLHATTKQYVDDLFGGAPPGGISEADADLRYVNVTGDTMTGGLTLGLINGSGAGTSLKVNNNWLPFTDGNNYYDAPTGFHYFRTAGVQKASIDSNGAMRLNRIGLLDTNSTHHLMLVTGSDLTAERQLTIVTGDAGRTLTFTGSATVNQDVSTLGSPSFVAVNIGNPASGGLRQWTTGDAIIGIIGTGSAAGVILEGFDNGHVAVGIRNNDAGDSFSVVSQGTNTDSSGAADYSFLAMKVTPTGTVSAGAALTATTQVLIGSAAPTAGNHATRKDYVDSITGGSQAALDARYVNVDGDTMTGVLTITNGVAASRPLTITAAASQTGQLTRWQTSALAQVASVESNGDAKFRRVGMLDSNASHTLFLVAGSDLTADRNLQFATGDASRVLWIMADSAINQDVQTSATPTFAQAIASTAAPTLASHLTRKDYVDGLASQSVLDTRYVNVTGDTMTGVLTIANTAGLIAGSITGNHSAGGGSLIINSNWLPFSDGRNYFDANAHVFRALDTSPMFSSDGTLFTVNKPASFASTILGNSTIQAYYKIITHEYFDLNQLVNFGMNVLGVLYAGGNTLATGQASLQTYGGPPAATLFPSDQGWYPTYAYKLPVAAHWSDDGTAWTAIPVEDLRGLFSWTSATGGYTCTHKHLRIRLAHATYTFPALMIARYSAGTLMQMTVTALDAAGATHIVHGPTNVIHAGSSAIQTLKFNTFDGVTTDLLVTLTNTDWAAGGSFGVTSLMAYRGVPGHLTMNEQSKYPFSWDKYKTVTFQSNYAAAASLVVKAAPSQSVATFAIQDSSASNKAWFASDGTLTVPTINGNNPVGGPALRIGQNWFPYTNQDNYFGAGTHHFRSYNETVEFAEIAAARFKSYTGISISDTVNGGFAPLTLTQAGGSGITFGTIGTGWQAWIGETSAGGEIRFNLQSDASIAQGRNMQLILYDVGNTNANTIQRWQRTLTTISGAVQINGVSATTNTLNVRAAPSQTNVLLALYDPSNNPLGYFDINGTMYANQYQITTTPPTLAAHATRKDYVDSHDMPVGGTTGQVLAKTSATDYATSWQTLSGGGGITEAYADTRYVNVAGDTMTAALTVDAAVYAKELWANDPLNTWRMRVRPLGTFTANRTFSVNMGDADRTLTLNANVSLNQSLTNVSAVMFTDVTVSNAPVNVGHATRKDYVDAQITAAKKLTGGRAWRGVSSGWPSGSYNAITWTTWDYLNVLTAGSGTTAFTITKGVWIVNLRTRVSVPLASILRMTMSGVSGTVQWYNQGNDVNGVLTVMIAAEDATQTIIGELYCPSACDLSLAILDVRKISEL